jgi:hypothetical protein
VTGNLPGDTFMSADPQTKNETPSSSIWAGGLLALSLIIFQGFLAPDITCLDIASLVSISALALAIPMLSYKIFINTLRERKRSTRVQPSSRHNRSPHSERFFFVGGSIAALIGTAAAFYHMQPITAVIFSICTTVTFVAYLIENPNI